MNNYNGRNGNGYQPLPGQGGYSPKPPQEDGSLSIKGWQQENAELQDEIARLRKSVKDWRDRAVRAERNVFCGRHKHRVAHFCDECFSEVMAERNRLLVIATKYCDTNHHDWQEIVKIADDCHEERQK